MNIIKRQNSRQNFSSVKIFLALQKTQSGNNCENAWQLCSPLKPNRQRWSSWQLNTFFIIYHEELWTIIKRKLIKVYGQQNRTTTSRKLIFFFSFLRTSSKFTSSELINQALQLLHVLQKLFFHQIRRKSSGNQNQRRTSSDQFHLSIECWIFHLLYVYRVLMAKNNIEPSVRNTCSRITFTNFCLRPAKQEEEFLDFLMDFHLFENLI